MKEKIQRWCNSGKLSIEDACFFINEYLSYSNRIVSPIELNAILALGQNVIPLNWDFIIGEVANHNGLQLELVYSKPNQQGNRQLLYRLVF